MNLASLTPVLNRVAALYGLVDAASGITYALRWLFDRPANMPVSEVIVIDVAFLVRLFGFLALFVFARTIARCVFKSESSQTESMPSTERLEGTALLFLGCYLVAYSIVDTVQLVGKLYLFGEYSERTQGMRPFSLIQPDDYARIWSTAVKFLLACGFVFFSRGIVAFKDRMLKLRDWPTPPR